MLQLAEPSDVSTHVHTYSKYVYYVCMHCTSICPIIYILYLYMPPTYCMYLHTFCAYNTYVCTYIHSVPTIHMYIHIMHNLHSVLHRISLCSLPGDPYNMADMLRVWLNQPLSWYDDNHHQQVLQAFLCERGTFVHIALKGHSLISKQAPTRRSGMACPCGVCICA